MAFEKLARFDPLGNYPAALSHSQRGGGRDHCVCLYLHPRFAREAGFAEGEALDVFWGNGADDGLVRVAPATAGEFRLVSHRNTLLIDLGVIDHIPRESFAKATVAAQRFEGAIIVTLPAWARSPECERRDVKPATPRPAKPPPQPPADVKREPPQVKKKPEPPASSAAAAAAAPIVPKFDADGAAPAVVLRWPTEIGGIGISVMDGHERILAGRGGHVDCSPRAAQLVSLLAKAEGQPVDEDFCIRKLWAGVTRPPGVSTLLDMIISDLRSLKAIGLEVRKLRGVGLQLVVLS